MSLEGRIDIDLQRRAGRVAAVTIRSSRPQLAQKLFAGRTPDETVQQAGSLFSLCGQAQGLAARLACDAALGLESNPPIRAVLIELAQEHAWRLLLSWPQQAGLPPDQATLLDLRQAATDAFAERLETALSEHLLGLPPADWLGYDLDALDAWTRRGSTLPAHLFAQLEPDAAPATALASTPWLPSLAAWSSADIQALAGQALADPTFCAQPTWQCQPAETGALARQREHPLLAQWLAQRGLGSGARLLARLVELAQMPSQLRFGTTVSARAWPLGEGVGAAGVETSRGLLLHVARLADGQIADYRILAPTEWNFHPRGALSTALLALASDARIETRAKQVALALDPCVDYGLEIVDA